MKVDNSPKIAYFLPTWLKYFFCFCIIICAIVHDQVIFCWFEKLLEGIVNHLKFLWVKSRNWILIHVSDREVRICRICTGYRKLNFPENGSRHQFWLIEWLQLKWSYGDISAPFYWYKYRCVIVSEALGSCFAVILIHLIYFWTNRDVCRAKMFLNLRRNGIGKTNDLWDLGCSYSSLRENEGTQFGMCTTVCEENKLVVVFVVLSNLVYLILNFRVLYIFCCFLVSYLIKIMDFCLYVQFSKFKNNLVKIFNKYTFSWEMFQTYLAKLCSLIETSF